MVGDSPQNTILDAEGVSGVIYCYQDNDFSLESMTIENGYSVKGAGIYLSSSSPIISNLHIKDNYATENGAGIYCSGSNPTISNIIISDNAANYGAGVYCLGSNPNINKVTMYNNIANNCGGGLGSGCESFPILENCILWNNTPHEIYLGIEASVTALYSDIQNGTG